MPPGNGRLFSGPDEPPSAFITGDSASTLPLGYDDLSPLNSGIIGDRAHIRVDPRSSAAGFAFPLSATSASLCGVESPGRT